MFSPYVTLTSLYKGTRAFAERYELNLYLVLSQNYEIVTSVISVCLFFFPSVCLSFQTEQLGSHRTDFHEISN